MNIAVSTTCSDGYVIFLAHFIRSILKHNPKFNYDFVVFCDPRLSQVNRDKLKNLYCNFIFHDVDYNLYQDKRKSHMKYYSIEMFNLDYDRVIYWGSDMLCVNSLHDLFHVAKDIEGVAMPKEKNREDGNYNFNNGSMIIGEQYTNNDTYTKLLDYDNLKPPYNLTDQKLYNNFFKDITEIDQKYNTLVSEVQHIVWDEIVILHYIYKPIVPASIGQLNNADKRLFSLWRQYD